MITDSQIKSAIRRIAAGEKPRIDLKDDGERGAGRLALVCRRMKTRIATEWYAVYYRKGRRALSKVGSYPTMSLADARKRFREDYAPTISAGAEPSSVVQRRRHQKHTGTVRELFTAYVDSLKASGKRSASAVEVMLLAVTTGAVEAIGPDKAASSIEPADIVPHLADIHARGALVMASQVRAYISAAFSFGMRAENDYRRKDAGMRWGLRSNPAAAIPADSTASQPGSRFLTPSEFRTFWRWLEAYDVESKLAPAVRLLMATGQRVEEILRISKAAYERPQAMLFWEKTKNGLPHAVPLPMQAIAIIEVLKPNKEGLYFPNRACADQPAGTTAIRQVVGRFLEDHPEIPHLVPKDTRRTWKTLAGDAGVSKEMRDRIQNHSKKSDVSSRHYDRYDYLAEKREAMAKWAAYLDLVISGEVKELGQRGSTVVPSEERLDRDLT
jgi:integrase